MKLVFPEKILDQHLVVLGKTGAGKSSSLRHMVEHLLNHKKRVCIVDPKGDWWGLKSSADGQGPGFPVIAFGSFKEEKAADIPINDRSGRHVAELIAGGNRPCIIGFRGWMPGALTRFWIDFASTLFNSNAGELYLVIDEVHNFAAKGKIMDPEAGKCLHWTNRLMAEGRGVGLVCLIASQRPQKVHNDTLTCCETLVAMRVNHAADRQATKDWIDGCGDKEQGNQVLANIASLSRGEAYVWSPEIGFGPTRVKFPMFETFDSFAPPQLQKKVSAKGWETTDLEAVKVKLAKVIEEEKARDPAELNKVIAALRKTIADTAKSLPPPAPEVRYRDRPVLDETDRANMRRILEDVKSLCHKFAFIEKNVAGLNLGQETKTSRPHFASPSRPQKPPVIVIQEQDLGAPGDLDTPKQAIVDHIAMLGERGIDPTADTLARWLGIHPNGGRYRTNLAWLRAEGYLEGCELTAKGRAAARTLVTGLGAAMDAVDGAQRQIIETLRDAGEAFTADTLAAQLGIHPNGGRYRTNLARLRTMRLIPERGEIYLTEAASR